MTATAGLDIKFTGDDEITPGLTQAAEAAAGATQAAQPAVPAPTVQSPPLAQPTGAQAPVASGLPDFEKAQVARTEIKISGAVAVNTRDEVAVSLDDRLRIVGEFRVTKVLHYVDKKTGDVVRQQIIAPLDELELVPWNPADPTDDGIVRAR